VDSRTPPYLLQQADIAPRAGWLRRHRWFIAIVLLPTTLVALWLFLFAADQYESEAHFLVRKADQGQSGSSLPGFAQMVGLGGALGGGGEAVSVADYLDSHDAVMAADERLDLTALFRRPEADFISRLWYADPDAEDLVRHFRGKVDVAYDIDTGITELAVRAYRPQDAEALTTTLLQLGEERVNALNERGQEALLESARRQLDEAEADLGRVSGALAAYRRSERQVDPTLSGRAGTELETTLRGELAQLRSQDAAMSGIAADSPQRVALRRRIAAVEAEVAAAEARISGGRGLTAAIGNFEDLRMRQEFAAKRYELAAGMYEKARSDALRQNLFVVRIVEPNLPERALYPRRITIVLTVLAGLALAYGIGWLLLAGMREHAA
jgi:capsular polysaccharide transport system permease protein|tara:strand:+ start:68146 stop:69294 length:1149 start_codon:yes stop_codon:yes gene_type:complete